MHDVKIIAQGIMDDVAHPCEITVFYADEEAFETEPDALIYQQIVDTFSYFNIRSEDAIAVIAEIIRAHNY
jgi:hypothetical protein